MSITNTSNLIPSNLYGKSVNDEVSIEITPNGIVLGGDLTTTPITATISQAGIITDNPTGFNILSSINMNGNNITNVDTLSSTSAVDLTLSSQSGAYFLASDFINITATADSMVLTAGDDITLTGGSNINLTGVSVNISNSTGFTNSISLNNTTGDTTISSAFGSVNISSGNGDAGASSITLNSPEGDIVLNTGAGAQVSSNAPITSSIGYTGKVYHTDQPTTALTYYLTFVQSGGVSGYYDPAFDSATLTYNPSTNLLSVAGLQLSGATIVGTFATGVLSLGCNESSSRQFQFGMTANITGLTLSNRRTNGVYTCSIYNVSGSTWTISNVLTGAASNKTDYSSPISIANGEFAVLTANTLATNGTAYNYISVVKYS